MTALRQLLAELAEGRDSQRHAFETHRSGERVGPGTKEIGGNRRRFGTHTDTASGPCGKAAIPVFFIGRSSGDLAMGDHPASPELSGDGSESWRSRRMKRTVAP